MSSSLPHESTPGDERRWVSTDGKAVLTNAYGNKHVREKFQITICSICGEYIGICDFDRLQHEHFDYRHGGSGHYSYVEVVPASEVDRLQGELDEAREVLDLISGCPKCSVCARKAHATLAASEDSTKGDTPDG